MKKAGATYSLPGMQKCSALLVVTLWQVFLTPSGSCSSSTIGIRGELWEPPSLPSHGFPEAGLPCGLGGFRLSVLCRHCHHILQGRSVPNADQGFPLVEAGSQDTICGPGVGFCS